jgi:mutator protein MutT
VAAGDGAAHQVVAGLLVRQGRVLLCHRSPDRAWYPDVWDFPGGHVEAGETAPDALVREVREEVGVVITAP